MKLIWKKLVWAFMEYHKYLWENGHQYEWFTL